MSTREPKGNQCKCAICGEVFSTEANFDRHRVGAYQPNTRRCLPPSDVGLINKDGVWVESADSRFNSKP